MGIISRIKRGLKRRLKKLIKGSSETKKKELTTSEKYYIELVSAETGWSPDEAYKAMKDARKKYKVRFADYAKNALYNVPEDKLEDACKAAIEKREAYERKKARRMAKRNEGYIDSVVEMSGMDRETALKKMTECRERTGMSFEHYKKYRFWEVPEEEQGSYFTKGMADELKNKYNRFPNTEFTFVHKNVFISSFKDYIGRISLYTVDLKEEQFLQAFAGHKKLIYKPESSTGGNGVEVFDLSTISLQEVFKTIKSYEPGVVEEFLIQHKDMAAMFPGCVNTIRVVTVRTDRKEDGIEPETVHFLYAGLRIGRGDSIVDNLHSGGLVTGIDIETGIITTDGTDFQYRTYDVHPETGTKIKGFVIPYFREAKELITRACIEKEVYGYYGWDIAITEKGPVIVESNTHPGAEIIQTAYLPLHTGMGYVAAEYIGLNDYKFGPEKPYGTKISKMSREGIEFYWKKPERAKGYDVFRAYSADGPFELIAEIPSRRIGEYTDSEFDRSAKEIYYSVRSYLIIEDDVKIYSDKTAPVRAVPRTEMEPSRAKTYMYSGSDQKLTALFGWGDAMDAEWRSEDPSIATVTKDGSISAVSAGKCTLRCVSKELGKECTAEVVVDREPTVPLDPENERYGFDQTEGIWKYKKGSRSDKAEIMMAGDLMCSSAQMRKQYTEKDGWNFNSSFRYVRPVTARSDLAVANLETLLASPWPYMVDEAYIDNKNNCNAPARYLDAVRYGGFDSVMLANNHNCDGGVRSLIDTIEQVEKYEFPFTGVFKSADENRFVIIDINGIKVGFVAYMSEKTTFNGKDADWTDDEKETYLHVYTKKKAKADIKACREAGAEFIIAYMHWGVKNFRNITDDQKKLAQGIADAGADFIAGSNPHIVQIYDEIETNDGRVVPCYYSIGNFQAVMNQIPGNRDSVMIDLVLKREKTGEISIEDNAYIPFHCYSNVEGCLWAPVPLHKKYNTSPKKSAKIAERIAEAIGDKAKIK